jgi:predicted enzyme related to lactoylglutathione lyase
MTLGSRYARPLRVTWRANVSIILRSAGASKLLTPGSVVLRHEPERVPEAAGLLLPAWDYLPGTLERITSMTIRDTLSVGAPCLVDTFQPDPRGAMDFYGPLFGWSFDHPAPMPAGLDGDYCAARLRGRRVAGIGQAPAQSGPTWNTHVRVGDLGTALLRTKEAGGTLLAGPFGAGSGGGFAVVADSTGVPFCLRQAGDYDGAELADEPDTWAMSSLHTADVERAQAFYGAMFGWDLEPVPGASFALWRLSGRVVAVVSGTAGTAVPPHWSVNFAVRDADSMARQAVALGGSILMAPMDTPGFRNAVIGDPQGGFFAVSAAAG